MSVNKAILIGNLGHDPEMRYTQSGQAVCNFNLATNEQWKDRDGQRQERTEWHRIVVFGKQAEACKEYLAKGRQVFVEGRIQTREWEDRDGNKRWTTEVVALNVRFLSDGQGGSGADGGGGNRQGQQQSNGGGGYQRQQQAEPQQQQQSYGAPTSAPAADANDDDIPF